VEHPNRSAVGRTRTRVEAIRARARRAAERAEALRAGHGSVDAVYTIVDRDGEVGGGIMAGSLAYRIFVWLLPFALVVVGGIGVTSQVASESPESAAKSLGLSGLVSNSVAEAAQGSSRWYALLIGVPVLVWATRNLLRALVVVHRLVWGDPRRAAPKATLGATVRLLVLLVAYSALQEVARAIESWSGTGWLGALIACLGSIGLWLLISMRLPHRDAPWRALVPGAIMVAVGLQLISIAVTYVIEPRITSSQSTYGALGVAATLLFGLYLISRLVVASAIVNVAIWDRRNAGSGGADVAPPDAVPRA
jgi:membrane protein